MCLLPNGSVVGFGQSKLRHFSEKPNPDPSSDYDVIPLIVKPTDAAKTDDEKKAQREIEEIGTFKRTTVCRTRAGAIYACGDKFARTLKLSAESALPFGFYQLPVGSDTEVPEPVKPSQADDSKKNRDETKETEGELGIAELFEESKDQPSDDQQKTLSHSEAKADLAAQVVEDPLPEKQEEPEAEKKSEAEAPVADHSDDKQSH